MSSSEQTPASGTSDHAPRTSTTTTTPIVPGSPDDLQSTKPTNCAVQVAVRIRPLNKREMDSASRVCCQIDAGTNSIILHPPTERTSRKSTLTQAVRTESSVTEKKIFNFDYVYGDVEAGPTTVGDGNERNSQERVFKDLGSIVLENAFNGFNCSLLAYGQTGSGKSHTVMGYKNTSDVLQSSSSSDHIDYSGIIPRISAALFNRIATNTNPNISYKVEVSYLEIYSEKIADLLNNTSKNLKVREHPSKGPYVDGLSVVPVNNYDELESFIEAGNSERTVAATQMNDKSSRSHAIFSILFTTTHIDREVKLSSDVVSKIHLVDLAGSERAEFTGATGIRLKEAAMINQSLSTLGRVVQALAMRSQAEAAAAASGKKINLDDGQYFVPFRDSVLTWLLRESLGGNSKTLMIACVSPADQSFEETLSTLRYASRAKNIVNKAVVNEDPNGELIRNLRREIDELKSQLNAGRRESELSDESVKLVERLRQQLLENAETMAKMEALYRAKLEATQKESEATQNELQQQHLRQIEAEKEKQRLALKAAEEATDLAEWARAEAEAKEAELRKEKERAAQLAASSAAAAAALSMPTADTPPPEPEDLLLTAPFLVNLNEHPAQGEAILHHLFEGSTIFGGRSHDSSSHAAPNTADEHLVYLHGPNLRPRQASITFDPSTTTCTLTYLAPIEFKPDDPAESKPADIFVGGAPLFESRTLVHGDRIVFGTTCLFRFSCSKAELERLSRLPQAKPLLSPIPTSPLSSPSPATSPETSPDTSPEASRAASPAIKPASPPQQAPSVMTKLWKRFEATHTASGGVMDTLVARESKLIPKHRQRRPLQTPLTYFNSYQITVLSDAIFQWRYRLLRSSGLDDETMKMTFMVDEANAIGSAMGLPERYRIELHSRCVPPPLFQASSGLGLLDLPLNLEHDDDQPPVDLPSIGISPLTRLRSFKQVTLGVVSWRRKTGPNGVSMGVATNVWDHATFADQLLFLRKRYSEMIESPPTDAAPSLPIASSLQQTRRLQFLGSAFLYLEPLRYGHTIRHKTPVLDRRGEFFGFLTCELSIKLMDARQAQIEMEREEGHEKGAIGEDDQGDQSENSRSQSANSLDDESTLIGDEDVKKSLDTSSSLLVLTVRILTYDQTRLVTKGKPTLQQQGVKGLQIRYCLHEDPHLFTTRTLRVKPLPSTTTSPTSASVSALPTDTTGCKLHFHYRKSHYFGGGASTLTPAFLDYLSYDALTFDVIGKFGEIDNELSRQPESELDESFEPSSPLYSPARPNPTANGASAAASTKFYEALTLGSDGGDSDDEDRRQEPSKSSSRIGSREGSKVGGNGLYSDSNTNPLDIEFGSPVSSPPSGGLTLRPQNGMKGGLSGMGPIGKGMPRLGSPNGPIKPTLNALSQTAAVIQAKAQQQQQALLYESVINQSSEAFTSSAPATSASALTVSNTELETPKAVSGRKSTDHLLYVCMDLEEEEPTASANKKPTSPSTPSASSSSWSPVPLKTEADGSLCFKLTTFRQKRLILSLLQVDSDATFVIESLASVAVKKLTKQRGLVKTDYDLTTNAALAVPLTLLDQVAHTSHRLLVATIDFSRVLLDHDLFREPTREGDRIKLTLAITLYFSKSTQSVTIPYELVSKVYKKASSSSSSSTPKEAGPRRGSLLDLKASSSSTSQTPSTPPSDPTRLPKLGQHFLISRQATSMSIANVYTDHLRNIHRLARRLRHEQCLQHQIFIKSLITSLRELEQESVALNEPSDEFQKKHDLIHHMIMTSYTNFIQTLDSSIKIITPPPLIAKPPSSPTASSVGPVSAVTGRHRKSLSFGFTNVAAGGVMGGSASGIQVMVELIPRSTGLKCGFLQKQSGMSKAGPSTVASPNSRTVSSSGKWSPKWCVLRLPYLFYYNKRTDIREKGIIHLFQARIEVNQEVTDEKGTKKFPHAFYIHTHTRSYHLQAASEEEMISWIRAIDPSAIKDPAGSLTSGTNGSIISPPKSRKSFSMMGTSNRLIKT